MSGLLRSLTVGSLRAGGNGSSYDCPPSNSSGNPWEQPSCASPVTWANTSLVSEVLVPLFARMFAPTAATRPNISTNGDGGSWFHYAEANIAGTIPYPE